MMFCVWILIKFDQNPANHVKKISQANVYRPILMTSFAFIFGVSPLVFATGAGAIARQTIGWSVLGGMLAATALGIFIIPVLFILIIRLTYGKQKLADLQAKYNSSPATSEQK